MKKLKKPNRKGKGLKIVLLYDDFECQSIKNNYCKDAKCVRTCG